jgi:hypothetical protein
MLAEALAEGENVDYREVSFILGRLSALQKPELIPTVIENLERLYPVAEAVAAFFQKFTKLEANTRRDISNALLAPMLHARDARYVHSDRVRRLEVVLPQVLLGFFIALESHR